MKITVILTNLLSIFCTIASLIGCIAGRCSVIPFLIAFVLEGLTIMATASFVRQTREEEAMKYF